MYNCRQFLYQKMRNNLQRASEPLPTVDVIAIKNNINKFRKKQIKNCTNIDDFCHEAKNGGVSNPMLNVIKYIDERLMLHNTLPKTI